ncbi:5-carboxymethyl-2-hydroxymuconate Delta-isomerase [Dokdonia ponticola]|uniref:5-carboxymethyl-2-hydroxymuconate Delta-isomerase n=1 Tax=Dokdonia ponticola TaxID=2041041 RepID=A0ABV9I2Y0_9FLAO
MKVRINSYKHYNVGNTKNDFIHIFANIMEGRTSDQKGHLSKTIVTELKKMFLTIPVISMNVRDFEKATYCNKSMVQP